MPAATPKSAQDNTAPRKAELLPIRTGPQLSAATLPWQVQPGRHSHTVVVKATLDLLTGKLRDEADVPCGDIPFGDTLSSSLRYPSDFAILKPRCDVVLHGHAHAGGKKRMQLRFRFGRAFDRRLVVMGPRRFGRDGIPTEPGRFDSLPLRWEHAFGGHAQPNPVGCGLGDVVPNIEAQGRLIEKRGDKRAPMGVAAIPPLWPQRWGLLGTYDEAWLAERYPYFAQDMDWRFFQCAPLAQQLDALSGTETFLLEGVHAEHQQLRGQLPGILPQCAAVRGDSLSAVPLRLDTVVFQPEVLKAQLIWRGRLDVAERAAREIDELYVVNATVDRPLSERQIEQRYLIDRSLEAGVLDAADLAQMQENDSGAAEDDALAARIHARLQDAGITLTVLAAATQAPAKVSPAAPKEPPALDHERRRLLEEHLEAGRPLDALDLELTDLSGMDLSGLSMLGCDLRRADLSRCILRKCDLRMSQMAGCDLRGADLSDALLDGADLEDACLEGAVLDGASLFGVSLEGVRGNRLSALKVKAVGLMAGRAELRGANFAEADLSLADFSDADLREAQFNGAQLEDARLYRALADEANFAGALLKDLRADEAQLSRACFDGAEMVGAVLDDAVLVKASLKQSHLEEAGLRRIDATSANFAGSRLPRARLAEANLQDASLVGANLMQATLEGALLQRSDLRYASLYGAELFEADLRGAKLEGADLSATKVTTP